MKKKNELSELTLYKLAELFVKYNYFEEDKTDYITYSVLLDVYESLPQESQDQLLGVYKILKLQKKRRIKK